MSEKKTFTETFDIAAENLTEKVKELIAEGNVRRISIRREGTTLFELPLTAGVAVTAATAVLAPALIAVGAIAAVLTQVTLVVERDVPPAPPGAPKIEA